MAIKISVNDIADELKQAIRDMDLPVKKACTAAVTIAGLRAEIKGQQDIAKAGLGKKMAASWHAKFYPGASRTGPTVPSINAAAFLYSKVPFIEVFQDGATIHGKPYLWVPLRNAPKTFGKGHISPKRLRQAGIKLFSISRAGDKPPLLATNIITTRSASKKLNFGIGAKKLKKATTATLSPRKKGQARMTIPLFFGIRVVTDRKILHLAEICQAELDNLAQYYVANLQPE